VAALDRAVQLAQEGALTVLRVPHADGIGQLVQLHAALALARPHVRQRAPELGVPEQGREVVEHDRHADVVHGAVGHRLDGAVGQRPAAEQPQVAGGRDGDRIVARERRRGAHGP
jgi:hypothetical protein